MRENFNADFAGCDFAQRYNAGFISSGVYCRGCAQRKLARPGSCDQGKFKAIGNSFYAIVNSNACHGCLNLDEKNGGWPSLYPKPR